MRKMEPPVRVMLMDVARIITFNQPSQRVTDCLEEQGR
jgi:hypothetical protein